MSLPGVFMTDSDGNLLRSPSITLTENVCGLLFDTSAQADIWTKGAGVALSAALKDKVIELNSLEDAKALGLAAYTGDSDEEGNSKDFLAGIPYYHIQHFFAINGGTGRLFVHFADCATSWEAIVDMQKAAHGEISQFGVWTEQNLWRNTGSSAESYAMNLVSDLQAVAVKLANDYHAPAVILLSANTATVTNGGQKELEVVWSKIPSCVSNNRYVAVLLGQSEDNMVAEMQSSLASVTPVGAVGAALGVLAIANVAHSIGWVERYNMAAYFAGIEFGFGNAAVSDKHLANPTAYEALTRGQLDTLEEKGYIFLMRHVGIEDGVYFSGDTTCSSGDYRTIARNRVINKSRRVARTVLLPYVNSPIKVDPANGNLSAGQIAVFNNLVTGALEQMASNDEISAIGNVVIPANQNILQNDQLVLQYSLIPVGTAKRILVTEGLAISRA